MSPRCSSRLSKASKKKVQKSPTPSQDVTPDKPRRQRGRPRKKDADSCKSDEDDGKDLLNLIDSTTEGDVEVVDYGLDESVEDLSDCSSIASGPSIIRHTTSKTPTSSQSLCSACGELYQRAKRTKAPIRNRLLDNDPKSLTCDQWVLIKHFQSRRLHEAKQSRLSDAHLNKIATSRPEESPFCSRMHIFLQRNLRRARMPARKDGKKNRTKRRRDSSQGCPVAKQQRLQSDASQKRSAPLRVEDESRGCFSSGVRPGRRSNPKTDPRADPESSVVERAPSSADTTKPTGVGSKQKPTGVGSKQKGAEPCGFKQLLAQLRGSSSRIVKEKH